MAPAVLYDYSSGSSGEMTMPASSSGSMSPDNTSPYFQTTEDSHVGSQGIMTLDFRPTDGHNDYGRIPNPMPVAIVGMACRLPGNVSSPSEFWELCARARSGFSTIPKERFNHEAFYHPNPGKTGAYHAAGGYFIGDDVTAFDAPFFGLTEKEALSMDPQQRLLLECTFEALESAGIPKHSIVGKDVGVFVGGSLSEYENHLGRDSDTIPMHQATGI
jgi:acyl transferase domain-containing protein